MRTCTTTLTSLIFIAVLPLQSPALPQNRPTTAFSTASVVLVSEPNIAFSSPIKQLPPILKKIAWCESGDRQFSSDGSVLRGRVHPYDVGRFQINTKVHLDTAQKLGFDVFTEEGNLAYALYLFETQGTQPWNASKSCWLASR